MPIWNLYEVLDYDDQTTFVVAESFPKAIERRESALLACADMELGDESLIKSCTLLGEGSELQLPEELTK